MMLFWKYHKTYAKNSQTLIPPCFLRPLRYVFDLTGGQEGEKAYVVRDTECGSKKR
ncbi:MAG: hypothetical protein ACKO3K_01235 [Cuspidothrix sp.]